MIVDEIRMATSQAIGLLLLIGTCVTLLIILIWWLIIKTAVKSGTEEAIENVLERHPELLQGRIAEKDREENKS